MHALKSWRFVATMGMLLAGSLGCASIPPIPDDRAILEPPEEYLIGPGDLLSVKFFYTPELNEDVSVRPDGKIALQLVGEIVTAGRTPADVGAELAERYANFLSRPNVAVIVKSFSSMRAYVGGEVKIPSMVPIDGRMSLAGAVFAAGGPLDTAALSSVVLLRRGSNGREVYRVDMSGALDGQKPLPILRAYDVVYVPKSVIAKVGMYVELYINKLIPRNGAFYAIYQIDQINPTADTGVLR